MGKFGNKSLAELAHQLLLSPKQQRWSQIQGIERLLDIVTDDKSYPYDFVCFQITGYRNRRSSTRAPLPGVSLIADLVTMAEEITRATAIAVDELAQSFFNYEELAETLRVSTKTIRRWRRRGLMGFRAQFEDGVCRLVYLQHTVERFKSRHPKLIARGAAFKQLSEQERDHIVARARALLSNRRMKMHVVARQLAEETGRAVETIRYTLRRYDQANPQCALFNRSGVPWMAAAHKQVWEAHERGDSTAVIAAANHLSEADVDQLLREMRARRLKADPVAFIPNDLFAAPDAVALILDPPRPPGKPNGSRPRPPADLPAYLRHLYQVPLLTAEQEVDAFRRYNFLKYRAARHIEALDPSTVTAADLGAIDDLREQYEAIRKEIVQANLRLVVSIAKKHVGWSPRFFETISDGNMSLMRAVEKFDFARGYKFSTYASWAIMKNYARTVPEEHYHFARYVTGQEEILSAAPDQRATEPSAHDADMLHDALRGSLDQLTERERAIVTEHFGLFDSGPATTLEDLGKRFGVTKERIRQIERRAITKMKAVLSPALLDLIPE